MKMVWVEQDYYDDEDELAEAVARAEQEYPYEQGYRVVACLEADIVTLIKIHNYDSEIVILPDSWYDPSL